MKYLVHHKRERYDVYIGRPSIWGNPFPKGEGRTRKEAVQKYRIWIQTQPELLAQIETLRGKILGCWCCPLECHGEVLLEILYPPVTLENFWE